MLILIYLLKYIIIIIFYTLVFLFKSQYIFLFSINIPFIYIVTSYPNNINFHILNNIKTNRSHLFFFELHPKII